jgi:hypothetical protein
MDIQPLTPGSTGPFSTTPSGGGGRSPLLIALLVVLGLGTITFGVLTVNFSNKASTAQRTLEQQKAAAVANAQAEQKKLDDINFTKVNESPFRAYTAPEQFGSFVINFPKNWSSYAKQQNSGTQVSLALNPDFIRNTDGQDDVTAVRVMLIISTQDKYLNQYTANIKSGKVKKTNITVSGQPAFDITGQFNGRKTIREVVVPIRDKVLVFSNESPQYATEFNSVLSQAKIIP